MNTFQAIDKFLTTVIEGYQMEARVVNNVAGEGCVVPPHNLKQLVEANARAEGAMQAKSIIAQTVAYSKTEGVEAETVEREALPRVIRALETRMDVYFNTPETHLQTVRVINDVLRSLRLEVEVVAAK